MALYNSKIEFVGSGVIKANVGTICFQDTFIADKLPLSEAGHDRLDARFFNTSILGALNELRDAQLTISGLVQGGVMCYTEERGVEATHTITHNLGASGVIVQMFDKQPGDPTAQNVITCYSPIDDNTVSVELDQAASGYFVVMGCK